MVRSTTGGATKLGASVSTSMSVTGGPAICVHWGATSPVVRLTLRNTVCPLRTRCGRTRTSMVGVEVGVGVVAAAGSPAPRTRAMVRPRDVR